MMRNKCEGVYTEERITIMYDEYYKKYNGLFGESLYLLKNRLVFRRNSPMQCIYCGKKADTREHCPPKGIFLRKPYPSNLIELPACRKCNNSYSADEEYTRDMLNCLYNKCHDTTTINYKSDIIESCDRLLYENILDDKVENVFSKVALGHAVYELSDGFGDDDWKLGSISIVIKNNCSAELWNDVTAPVVLELLPEIGSRSGEQIFIVEAISKNGEITSLPVMDWHTIQEGYYRYLAFFNKDRIIVKSIIREFMCVEINFEQEKNEQN